MLWIGCGAFNIHHTNRIKIHCSTWTMNCVFFSILNSFGTLTRSGNSALMMVSVLSRWIFSCKQNNVCTLGRPLFCHSAVYIWQIVGAKIAMFVLVIRYTIFRSFRRNIFAILCRRWGSGPGRRLNLIFSHSELQVKVNKNVYFYMSWHMSYHIILCSFVHILCIYCEWWWEDMLPHV